MAFPYPPGEGRVGKMQETTSCQLGPCPWALTFKQENKRSKEAIIPSAKETTHPEWLGGEHPLQLGWDGPLLLESKEPGVGPLSPADRGLGELAGIYGPVNLEELGLGRGI